MLLMLEKLTYDHFETISLETQPFAFHFLQGEVIKGIHFQDKRIFI